jgi:predicted enzyme related to lactoylglutathione lyase
MSITVFGAAFDARDAATIARFWADALGRQVADGASPDHAVVETGDSASSGPRLAFHRVPEPKTVKNRFHLDLITTDYEAETARLVALGATILNTIDNGSRWTTLADPEGNEFDLIAG